MFLKVIGFLVMLPSAFWLILTGSVTAFIWLAIGGCLYFLGHQAVTRAATANARYPCPQCAEQVLKAAKVCPHCRTTLQPQD